MCVCMLRLGELLLHALSTKATTKTTKASMKRPKKYNDEIIENKIALNLKEQIW